MTLEVHGVVAKEPLSLRLGRPSLVVSLEASTVEATADGERTVVDRTGILLVPRRTALRVKSTTPANRIAILGFDDALLAAVVRRYAKLGMDRARLDGWLAQGTALLPRTVWVHEIVHRYVFERHVLDEHDNLATRFLEIEILKELYYLFRDRDDGKDRASIAHQHSPPVERAVAYIEAHLFDPSNLDVLAKKSGASVSTLLRSFQRELGCRPGEYWRTRRLDEALVLLRSGRWSIAEVATKVGYENPTSFGYAFRQRFGRAPTAFRPARPTRPSPS
jgi:AraC-like DNA-binding protein